MKVKKYEIKNLTDILSIPEESIDDFLIDLKSWYQLSRSFPPLLEEVGKIINPELQAKVGRPKSMTWIDDGKHDARVHIKTPELDLPDEPQQEEGEK